MKKKNESSKAQKTVMIFVTLLILVAALTVSELIRLRPSYVSETPYATGTPGNEYLVTDNGGADIPSPYETPAATEAPAEKNDGVLSILLIGNDSQRAESGAADALVAASYNKTDSALRLVILPRELYVQIPGHGDDILGKAYELGGMELLRETVRQNFGIELDGCLVAEYEGLGAVIDALGGIDIDLSEEEAALMGLDEGTNHLSGEQALLYTGIESGEAGEPGRTERQRSVMLQITSHIGGLNSGGILKLAYAALPYISTDMNKTAVFAYALTVYNNGVKTIEKHSLPDEGGYEGEHVNGMSVIMTDMEENRRLISEWLYGG